VTGRGPSPSEFLSGTRGGTGRLPERAARRLADRLLDLALLRSARRLDALAAAAPERDVLVLSIYRGDGGLLPRAVEELAATRHRVRFALGSMGTAAPALAARTAATGLTGGKFENLNELLRTGRGSGPAGGSQGSGPAGGSQGSGPSGDWVLVVDDDVALPRRFLDRVVGIAEHHGLALAQPAQSLASHAAWPVTRRRRGALVRESRFVEIGPVTLFRADVLAELTPFPALRYGWGLDLHWAAVAQQRGWRLAIVDALPVRHEASHVAATYSTEAAIEEARAFLADRPFLDSRSALETRTLR
jgi:hypothetical protein